MHIRDKRKAKGLTLKELGLRIGCSESAMSQYETGRRSPDYETLLKIAEELDTTVSYLLTGADDSEPVEDETLRLAEELRNRPGMRLLFDAARNCTEEDLRNVAAFIGSFRKGEDD